MDVLGFPLEALLLGHYYLTTARSFWTWIAVLTAAFGFWRITAVSSRSRQKSDNPRSFQDPTPLTAASREPEEPQKTPLALTPSLPLKPDAESPAVCSVSDNVVRKGGKFAAYYCEEDDGASDEEDGVYERYDGVSGEDEGVDERYDGVSGEEVGVVGEYNGVIGVFDGVWPYGVRTGLPVVRTGDFGWYQCQDLTAINGSVVRSWDGGRRRRSSSRRASLGA
ncbi:uncharacterized protein LOC131227000 [Magnolia sinica]|uniref:uncharacterized protein LOC131227000 n=1 Tax=Magnolia sinica TaxID=86752 RepID=UPI00265B4555|nr:uncharacterized protein LOC131227000 [Magnolia sinica]